jgi:hypothetical protein
MQDDALGRMVLLARKVGLADHRRLGGTGGLPLGEERRRECAAWHRGGQLRFARRIGAMIRMEEEEMDFPLPSARQRGQRGIAGLLGGKVGMVKGRKVIASVVGHRQRIVKRVSLLARPRMVWRVPVPGKGRVPVTGRSTCRGQGDHAGAEDGKA